MWLYNLLEAEGKNDYTMLIIFGVIAVAFIVMSVVNSKNRKKQMAEDQKRKDSMCAGTKIITIGGIIGTVVSVDNEKNTYVLKTGNTEIELDKRSIYQMDLPESVKAKLEQEAVKEEKVEDKKEDKVEENGKEKAE